MKAALLLTACLLTLSVTSAQAQPAAKTKPAAAAKSAAAAPSAAPHWTVDSAQSAISFASSVSGQSFRGTFNRWSADIAFDPANLSGSRVRVVVDPASAASGDSSRDSTLKQGNWFDTAHFPQAIFEASSFRSLGANRYEASGTLGIKGKKTPLVLPFTLTIAGAAADMQGVLTLNRRTLGLGLDMDDATIPQNVSVTVRVKASRTP